MRLCRVSYPGSEATVPEAAASVKENKSGEGVKPEEGLAAQNLDSFNDLFRV